jgi:hypothetical protein
MWIANGTLHRIAFVAALAASGCSGGGEANDATGASGGGAGGAAGTAGTAGAAGQDAGPVETGPAEGGDESAPDGAADTGAGDGAGDGAADSVADGAQDGGPTQKYCDNPKPGFDEKNPGMFMFYDFGTTVMMGQLVGLGVGGFRPTAREDYCNEPEGLAIPIDTCTDQPAPKVAPQCTTKAECAPEQDCKPQTDTNNKPIPGTERCVTPQALVDVGPFSMTGFKDGPHTFQYNAQQHGAYTATSDGQIPPAWIAYDADYAFQGAGSGDAGLGAFQGGFHFPAAFEITSPKPVDIPGMPGIPGIEVDPTKDLVLEWKGGDPAAVLAMNLTGAGAGGKPISCRAKNDGSFTIPAAMVQEAKLGAFAFFNMLEIRMDLVGPPVTGQGITVSKISVLQTMLLNPIKK